MQVVRFSAESQKLAVAVGNFLQLNYERSLEFIKLYADILSIDKEVLKAEMTVMRNCIETFPNSYNLMQIASALPISSSSCERSFSAMRRIKNWLRSSMGQNRFSCLALANIEGEAAKSLKADDILDAFIKTGNRKILL
nr:unnamed protein product [Callosobruchus chinensis]